MTDRPWTKQVTSRFQDLDGEAVEAAAERKYWCEMAERARQALPSSQECFANFQHGRLCSLVEFTRNQAIIFEPCDGYTIADCEEALAFTRWFRRLAVKHEIHVGGAAAFLLTYIKDWKYADDQTT